MEAFTDKDYQQFLTETINLININLKKGGASAVLPKITAKQLDQALQLTLTPSK
mgnify:CR=1 FL=1